MTIDEEITKFYQDKTTAARLLRAAIKLIDEIEVVDLVGQYERVRKHLKQRLEQAEYMGD